MKKRTFCVYVYYAKGVPIYVGKGKKRRPWVHLSRTHNLKLGQFITWCKEEGVEVGPKVVLYTENEFDAFAHEHVLIGKYGRLDLGTGTLFNRTGGRFHRALTFKENEYIVKLGRLIKLPPAYKAKTAGLQAWERDHSIRVWRHENRQALRMIKQAHKDAQYSSTEWKKAEEQRMSQLAQRKERLRQVRLQQTSGR